MFSILTDVRTANVAAKAVLDNLRVVRLRGTIPKGEFVDILFQRIDNITCPVISVHRRKKNIEWILPVCDRGATYKNVSFEYFDAGENGIVKIDSKIAFLGLNIKAADLSKNKLGDNVNLLTKYPLNVAELMLSHNGIKKLSKTFLERLPLLTVLDLSHNLLEEFILTTSGVGELEHLDLSFNLISYIDPYVLVSLGTGFPSLVVTVKQNPFQCECENKHFIQELLLSGVFIEKESLTCLYRDTTIPIDEDTLSKIEDLCRLPSIKAAIATSSVLLFFTFLLSIVVTCRRYRARKEKRRFQTLLDRYRTDPNRSEFPVFLSFSSRDQDLAHTYVLPRLNRGLQKILETSDRCVATGDLNFLPGFTVAGEII